MKATKKSIVKVKMNAEELKDLSSALEKVNTHNIGFNNRGLTDKEVKALTSFHEAVKKS